MMSAGKKKNRKSCTGQIMTEYVLMMVSFLGLIFIMYLLLAVFMDYGWRIMALVGWEPWGL